MTTIFLFPGQGSQHAGMGNGLFEKFPSTVRQADEELGYSIQNLCLEDPSEKLRRTEYTQPALYTVSALTYLELINEGNATPEFVAGHSVGEYAALFAAGAFDFITGLKLVKKRGTLMSHATSGAMAAIHGVSPERVKMILEDAELTSVELANFNTPLQTVISGHSQDIHAAEEVFNRAGVRGFIPLRVSGAFHSRLMEPARQAFEDFLGPFEFSNLKMSVISNVTAKPHEDATIKTLLIEQITKPVHWTASMRYLLNQPAPQFQEVGPGSTLRGLLRRIVREQQS